MAKVKNFKTIFPAVSVPLKDDYSIDEKEFRAYLRWIKSFYDNYYPEPWLAVYIESRLPVSDLLLRYL